MSLCSREAGSALSMFSSIPLAPDPLFPEGVSVPIKSTRSTPIRIGYCLSLTGPLADNSRSARLAHDIWREDINNRGGPRGRPVELVCHDDRAYAALVPGIYQRLMD